MGQNLIAVVGAGQALADRRRDEPAGRWGRRECLHGAPALHTRMRETARVSELVYGEGLSGPQR